MEGTVAMAAAVAEVAEGEEDGQAAMLLLSAGIVAGSLEFYDGLASNTMVFAWHGVLSTVFHQSSSQVQIPAASAGRMVLNFCMLLAHFRAL